MRWQRGLLRLWLVASVIWLLITGAAFGVPQSLVNVISWREPPKFDPLKPFTTVPPPSDDPFAKYATPTPPAVKPPPGFTLNEKPWTPPDAPIAGQKGAWTPPDAPIGKPAASPTPFEAHATAIANLRGFLFAGIGFPVGVFVFGIAGWWVVRGFKPAS